MLTFYGFTDQTSVANGPERTGCKEFVCPIGGATEVATDNI